MSRITKNKKRINPRYFLNETVESSEGDYEARITTGTGEVPGLKPGTRGKSILVHRGESGWGPRADGKLQIHVLPKAIGMYESYADAVQDGMSGEAYYMSEEEIQSATMADSVQPGQFSQSKGSFSYGMNEETKNYGKDQGADTDRAVELVMAAIQNVLGSTVGVSRAYSDKYTGYEIALSDGSVTAEASSRGIQPKTNNPELEAELLKMHKLFDKEMQAKKDSGGIRYRSVGESKQPTAKTLMEGLKNYSKGEE